MTTDEKIDYHNRCIQMCQETLSNSKISPEVKSFYSDVLMMHMTEIRNIKLRRPRNS